MFKGVFERRLLFFATPAFGHPYKDGEAVVAMVDNYL